jgi:DNA sulfur modification protein DndC
MAAVQVLRPTSVDPLRARSDEKTAQVMGEIRDRYMATDTRPWIIGYSGGKDSTLVAQLVFQALLGVPPKRRTRQVHILSSDTQVETPYIVDFVTSSIKHMREAAESLGLPIETHIVRPEVNDSYWVRMVGYGYPPPSRLMRWCTDRLKIRPANRFIYQQISSHGEVILLLGARYAESQARAESMRRHETEGGYHRHSTMVKAYVWSPIRHFTTEEVWAQLVYHDSPWGSDNKELRDLYKTAGTANLGGECPLVVDESTEPCGNSRFGCYVCTVVERDRSLEGFVMGGQEEYKDLLDLRNWLVEVRDNHENRMDVRRNGEKGIGPLKLEVRRQILSRLLSIQARLGEELVSQEEVRIIRQAWISDSLEGGAQP